jgi:predicted nuclease with TOPRIM domain
VTLQVAPRTDAGDGDRLRERLQELRGEMETGRERLAALERERTEVRDTLLRISGAVQVLEELLGERPAVALAG